MPKKLATIHVQYVSDDVDRGEEGWQIHQIIKEAMSGIDPKATLMVQVIER